jgi:hypothetical protein
LTQAAILPGGVAGCVVIFPLSTIASRQRLLVADDRRPARYCFHNGLVPTLNNLLKPVAERPVAVGRATVQTKFDYTVKTTGCADRNSGNRRCGDEFGTSLPPGEKPTLLEHDKKP